MIANAEMIIVVDIWSEDLHWIEEALLEAESRGITVILIIIGACQLPLINIFVHARDEEWPTDERKFSVLCDSCSAILGSFGSAIKPSALETDHPAVIETLKNAFIMISLCSILNVILVQRLKISMEKTIKSSWNFIQKRKGGTYSNCY